MKHTIRELQELQALPLDLKVRLTKQRIREWIREFGEDGVYVSFSGGKDSTVLLDIVREEYPNVKAVFVDVPTQYPELKQFVQKFDNVDIIRPKMNFFEVCEKYGFPLISKEVSECVEGARKYLTSLLKSESVLTNKQTNRIPYRYWYERVTGTGNYQKKANIPSNLEIVEKAHLEALGKGEHHYYQYETMHLLGTCKAYQYNGLPKDGIGGGNRPRTVSANYERKDGEQKRGTKSKTCDHVGDADKGQEQSDKGEYP